MIQNKFQNYLLIIVFIGFISFPFLNSQLGIVKDIKSSENRKMAALPKFDVSYLDKFPGEFDKYYVDNFSLRSTCIKYYNAFTLDFFKKSPIPDQLVIGKDNWLFSGGDELLSYRGKNSLSKEDLEKFKKELEYRKAYLEKRGCKFYVMVAPIKASIYSNKMPDNIFRMQEKSWGEQLISYLETNSDINTINVYPLLKSKTKEQTLYFKLDNHWNAFGAYYAANEFLQKVHKDIPAVQASPLENFNVNKKIYKEGNLASMLSDTKDFSDTLFGLNPKTARLATKDKAKGYPCENGFPYCNEYEVRASIKNPADTSKPKLLIISDSFGAAFFPFVADEFRESVKIFDSWQYKLNEPIVKNEKPDVVLLIMLDANIKNLLQHTSNPDIEKSK